jgi:hypothetical protein
MIYCGTIAFKTWTAASHMGLGIWAQAYDKSPMDRVRLHTRLALVCSSPSATWEDHLLFPLQNYRDEPFCHPKSPRGSLGRENETAGMRAWTANQYAGWSPLGVLKGVLQTLRSPVHYVIPTQHQTYFGHSGNKLVSALGSTTNHRAHVWGLNST